MRIFISMLFHLWYNICSTPIFLTFLEKSQAPLRCFLEEIAGRKFITINIRSRNFWFYCWENRDILSLVSRRLTMEKPTGIEFFDVTLCISPRCVLRIRATCEQGLITRREKEIDGPTETVVSWICMVFRALLPICHTPWHYPISLIK